MAPMVLVEDTNGAPRPEVAETILVEDTMEPQDRTGGVLGIDCSFTPQTGAELQLQTKTAASSSFAPES